MSVSVTSENINNAESERFNLLVLRESNSEILLSHQGDSFALPQIAVPKRQRIVRWVTEDVQNAWNLRTVCLFEPETQNVIRSSEDQYIVLEPRDQGWQPQQQLSWVSRHALNSALSSANQCDVIERILECADAYNSGSLPGTFARAGWIDELFSWAQEHANSWNLRLTGEFRQLNCGPFFSLLRLETNGPALWFKAVGEPNLQEYCITLELARNHPRYVPKIIAARTDWNGWLMLEVHGKRLDFRSGLQDLRRVAETLANLQLGCLAQTQRLLEIGCKDRRIATLIPEIEPFLDVMEKLMREQPSEAPRPLNPLELKALGAKLKEACWRMQLAGIPDSLFHGDFNLGNLLMVPEDCVFLDWAEGCIGPPFLALEYLIAQLANIGLLQHEEYLHRAYARRWLAVVSEEQISETMLMSPTIAVLSYALGSTAWQYPNSLQEERKAKYFRSLTRRMCKELEKAGQPRSTSWMSDLVSDKQARDTQLTFVLEGV